MIQKRQSRRRLQEVARPLRFSPTAWAKLVYLRDAGPSEIGGFAIAPTDDPMLITDIRMVRQRCSVASVEFDDEAVADFFDEQIDAGLRPHQFARIWVHTHPGACPLPSWLDEATFTRVFQKPDWAIMFILARGGSTYARVRYNTGPCISSVLKVDVDYARPFPSSDSAAWHQEYLACVQILPPSPPQLQADGADGLQPAGQTQHDYDLSFCNFLTEPAHDSSGRKLSLRSAS